MAKSWNNSYALGIGEIDNQHMRLFDIFDRLLDAMGQGKANEIIRNIVVELENYSRTHFATEEKYMEQFNFPGIKEHKEAHAYYFKKIEETKADLAANKITVSVELLDFLKKWLVKHIDGTDKLYKEVFISNGVK